jgi:hypothetical protein
MHKGRSKWIPHLPFIRQSAGCLSRDEIAAAIGTSRANLYNICHNFGIRLPNESGQRPTGSKWDRFEPWLRANAGKLPVADLAAELGTTEKNIYNICYRYGISARCTRPRPAQRSRLIMRPDPFAGTKPRRASDVR